MEWAENVVDIREQFPLLDLEYVQTIASDMGVKYPTDKDSNFPRIFTNDFLITIRKNNTTFWVARTIKPSSELNKRNVIEKFEIERRYSD